MLHSCVIRAGVSTLWLTAVAVVAAAAQDESSWPQFRGRNVDGIAAERGLLNTGRAPSLVPLWKTSLGSGYSGVSIDGGLAVTMFTDGDDNILIAFDAETGRERWRFSLSPVYRGHDGSYDGPISTPLIDSNLTVALGPSGRLVAVDNLEGELVWSVDLIEDLGAEAPYYGFATSPLLVDGLVILQVGPEGGTVVAMDPETGALRWTAGDDVVSYQTPIPMTVNGRAQLIASGDEVLMGVDGSSGEVLWSHAHGGGGAVGSWAMVPLAAGADRLFLNYKDDSSIAVQLDDRAGAPTLHELWEARTIRNTYAVPVYHEGYVYAFSSRFLTCVDASTGEAVWKSRPPGDGFIILVDEHLVILTKDGSVHVARATPDGYEEVASRQIFEELSWTPPSFAGDSLFVRSLGSIARVEIGGVAISTSELGERDLGRGRDTGGRFEQFLAEVETSKDRSALVDAFFEKQASFPIVEDGDVVHFVYRGEAEDMAIGGDMIGGRQEESMFRVDGTNLFYYSTELRRDARVSYVFIKDFKDTMIDPLNPSTAQWAIIGADMSVDAGGGNGRDPIQVSSLEMPGWNRPSHLTPVAPDAPRGRLVRHELESAAVGRSHSIEVYLPAGYESNNERYPVVYYHGGDNAVKFGQLPNALDVLVGSEIEPMIVVFIGVTAGNIFMPRQRYGEMWAHELVPFIDENYRTIASRDGRANVGAGTTAHDAAHCAFAYSALSSKLAIQSLGVVDIGRGRLESLVTTAGEHPLAVHIEWGVYDLYNPHEVMDMGAETRRFAEFLASRGYAVESVEVPEGTGWPAWRNRTDAVLESLFPLPSVDR